MRSSRLLVPGSSSSSSSSSGSGSGVPPRIAPSVTCIAVHENCSLAAVGLSNNCVLLLRGDVTRDRGTKQKVLLDGSSSSITSLPKNSSGSSGTSLLRRDDSSPSVSGLAFKSASRISWLYVATTEKIIAFNVSIRDKESCLQLDNIGCPEGIPVLQWIFRPSSV